MHIIHVRSVSKHSKCFLNVLKTKINFFFNANIIGMFHFRIVRALWDVSFDSSVNVPKQAATFKTKMFQK